MSVLLGIDIDGTLTHRPRLWGHPEQRLAAWQRLVERGSITGRLFARRVLESLAGRLPEIVITTARPEALAEPTTSWLLAHYPMLDGCELLMRTDGDTRPSWLVRRDHVEAVRDGRRVVLLDDDLEGRQALQPEDVFLPAPSGWNALGDALERAAR